MSAGRCDFSIALATVNVLPDPVMPSRTWSRSPRSSPRTISAMACGWSPLGENWVVSLNGMTGAQCATRLTSNFALGKASAEVRSIPNVRIRSRSIARTGAQTRKAWSPFTRSNEPRVPREDDRVHQEIIRHEGERRVSAIDFDVAARIRKAARVRALERAFAPELLGGRASGGLEGDARARPKALVGFERAQILERIGDDVAVDAGAQTRAGGAEGAEVGQAVAEIA